MRLFLCLLAGVLCSGCFVFDEIDKGRELMETHSPTAKPPAGPATAAEAGAEGSSARQRLSEYYARLRAKAPAPSDSADPGDAIGQCRIGDSVRFLRRSDCQLRRGTFL